MTAIKFSNTNAQFFPTLKQRVSDYFEENKISPTGNYILYIKSAILISLLAATYIWLVFYTPSSILLALVLCMAMGFIFAGIGFNVMHDGAHGSYSKKNWLNNIMAYSLDLLGGSSYMWKYKHNMAHHSFTNIDGMDEDIDIRPFMRVSEGQKKLPMHKFQHIYGFLLYSLSYLIWIFSNDFSKYFKGKIRGTIAIPKMTIGEHVHFWATKIAYVAIFLIIPIFKVGLLKTILGYGLLVFVTGIVIAFTFQLAHVHEEAEFVAPHGEEFLIENNWAVHQMKTTANFATKQKWHGWFWGGLNYQIEHHLFPKISHIHYPAISKIVKQTCEEFNVAYMEFPTVVSAIYSHFMHLRALGSAA